MEKLRIAHQLRLNGDPAAGLGAEVALVDREVVDARLQQSRRHPVGVVGGVGVDEAAGVRGDGGVEGQGHLRGDLPQRAADLVDDLPAGRAGGVYAAGLAKVLEGGVVVHRQADAVNIGLRRREEEAPGGNVHGHDEGGGEIHRGPETVHIDGVDAGHVGVF